MRPFNGGRAVGTCARSTRRASPGCCPTGMRLGCLAGLYKVDKHCGVAQWPIAAAARQPGVHDPHRVLSEQLYGGQWRRLRAQVDLGEAGPIEDVCLGPLPGTPHLHPVGSLCRLLLGHTHRSTGPGRRWSEMGGLLVQVPLDQIREPPQRPHCHSPRQPLASRNFPIGPRPDSDWRGSQGIASVRAA